MGNDIFTPGLPLLLQVPKLEHRLNLRIIGWDRPLFLITNLPYVNDKPIILKPDEPCIIRFLKGDDAFGFQTSLVSSQFFPAPLIFFKYPAEVDQIAFRSSKRYRLNIPAKLLDPRTMETVDAELADISETGCRLRLSDQHEESVTVGKNYFLSFTILEKTLEIDCMLRNARRFDNSLFLGMEFAGLPTATRTSLAGFVSMLSRVMS